MAKQAKSAQELLAAVNYEMRGYDTCEDAKATTVQPIDSEGQWDVSLRASGAPSRVARSSVHAIVHHLNNLYRLKEK
jgi:hypothetical protein